MSLDDIIKHKLKYDQEYKKKYEKEQENELKEQNEIGQDLIKQGILNNANDKLDQMIANAQS